MNELLEALADYGVHEGFPQARRQLAADLMGAGFTAQDIERLGDWQLRQKARNQGAALAAVLADPSLARERLADIEFVAQRRAQKAGKAAVQPGEAQWARPVPPEDWREADLARRIAGSVDGDRHKLADACREFGITEERGQQLLIIGRQMTMVDGKPRRASDDEDEDARRTRFLEAMRRRQTLSAG